MTVTENYLGHRFTWLAEGRETGGQYSVVDALIRRGLEPPPHTHTHEDEAYYIVDGRVRFVVDGAAHATGPGDFVFLPRGQQHGFRLESDTARALIIMNPAGLEEAFHELSVPAEGPGLPDPPAGPPRVDLIVAAFAARGVQFPAPPPAAAASPGAAG